MLCINSNLGVHNHLVVNGKCKESLNKTKRLITKEFVHTPNAKAFAISLNASKTSLARHFLDDSRVGIVKTPLWPSVGVKPNTWKSRDLESSGIPECLELNSKAQNTSH